MKKINDGILKGKDAEILSIDFTLSQLADEGMLEIRIVDGIKKYRSTKRGIAEAVKRK